MTPPDHVGDDPVPHAGGGAQGLSTARLTGLLNGTYVPSSGGSLARYGQPTPATGDLDVANYSAPNAASPLAITTYVGGNSDVVEPSVYYNPNGFAGYEFWMAAGPYENSSAAVENPSIWVSHDGQTWIVPPGATNPVQGPPGSGNYDDPHLFEYKGTLYLTWNWSRNGGLADQVLMSSTTDGITWTSSVVLVTGVDGTAHELLSPHVEYHNGTWFMWTLTLAGGTRKIQRRTATSITGTWSAAVDCTTSLPSGLDHWEFEVRRVGGQWVMLQCLVASGQTASGGRLYLRTSADGLTWTLPPNPVLQASLANGSPWDSNFIYKSTFVPMLDGRIAIWYNAGNATPRWKIGYTVATRVPNKTPQTSSAWYAAPIGTTGTSLLVQGEEWFQPVYFDRATLLSNLGIEITTSGATGALIRLGVRGDTGDGRPMRLLLDAGTVDGTQAAGIYSLAAPIYVGPGWVWFTATGQGAPATQATVRTTSGNCGLAIGSTNTLASQNSLAGYKWGGGTTGALASVASFNSLTGRGAVARVLWQPA